MNGRIFLSKPKFFNTSHVFFFFLFLSRNPLRSFLNWISNLNLVSGSPTSQVATRLSGSHPFYSFFFHKQTVLLLNQFLVLAWIHSLYAKHMSRLCFGGAVSGFQARLAPCVLMEPLCWRRPCVLNICTSVMGYS